MLDFNQRNERVSLAGPRKAGIGSMREGGFSGQERAQRQSYNVFFARKVLSNLLMEVPDGLRLPSEAQVTSSHTLHYEDYPIGSTNTEH